MREITVYNTMTRQKEVFTPVTPGEAKMYVCGVTPYNHPHIGNARPFVTWDVIRRYMKHVGYKVTYVQNFTDVDDKIINTSNGEGVAWDVIASSKSDACSSTCLAYPKNIAPSFDTSIPLFVLSKMIIPISCSSSLIAFVSPG